MNNPIATTTTFKVIHYGVQTASNEDKVAEEIPVEIRYNGRAYAVLMATPANLPELAVGFSLSEDIISSYKRIDTVLVREQGDGFIVDIGVAGIGGDRMRTLKRHMAGRTGCSLCGVEKLSDLPNVRRRISASVELTTTAINKVLREFDNHQPLRQQTSAVHGAA